MKKIVLASLLCGATVVGVANAAVDLSPNAPDAKIATSKQYVDSGLSKKANKTDLTALGTRVDTLGNTVNSLNTDLNDMATQTWVNTQLGTVNVSGKQDTITCTSGVLVFTGAGTYECRALATGEYSGD